MVSSPEYDFDLIIDELGRSSCLTFRFPNFFLKFFLYMHCSYYANMWVSNVKLLLSLISSVYNKCKESLYSKMSEAL